MWSNDYFIKFMNDDLLEMAAVGIGLSNLLLYTNKVKSPLVFAN